MFEISHNNENLKQICLKVNKNYPLLEKVTFSVFVETLFEIQTKCWIIVLRRWVGRAIFFFSIF